MASEDTVVQAGRTVTEAAEFSRLEHAAVGTMYMTCTLGGLVTNVLLILTLLKDKAIFQRTTPWLHINLALANIGVVAPSPLPASSSFSGKWLYGEAVCQAYAFEGMFIGLAAIGSVISLCVERYVVSCRKEAMQQNSSPFYWLCTSINVGNALFWAAMPILGWARYSQDHTGTSCALDWKHPDESFVSYFTLLCGFSFILPMTLALLALYKSIPPADPEPETRPVPGTSASASSFSETQLRWLCLTFVLFVLAGWGPFAALCGWAVVADTTGVSMLAACLPPLACKAATMLYPLAYAVANHRFRAGYLSLLGAASDPVTSGKGE